MPSAKLHGQAVLGPLQEVFVLRKAFYLSGTKAVCSGDPYGLVHTTCMQAYVRSPFYSRMEATLHAGMHGCIALLILVMDMVACSSMFDP